jgi:hypothetical protein
MRFLKRKASLVQISKKQLELETAKQILQEVFHACPSDVEDMIHSKLEERSRRHEYEKGLWSATFSLGE